MLSSLMSNENNFRKFLSQSLGARSDSFVYDGVEFSFEAIPDGENYIAILFPDPQAALVSAKHSAKHNGRLNKAGELRPYPIEIYGDVLAILKTYKGPDDCAPPDITEVFHLFDSSPELFVLMRGAALEVLGVVSNNRQNSGLDAWSAVFNASANAYKMLKDLTPAPAPNLVEALGAVHEIFALAREAVGDFKANPRDQLGEMVKLDPELEVILGN